MSEKHFPCKQCGADLAFHPGTSSLKCQYCSFENPIPQSGEEIREQDYEAALARLESGAEAAEVLTVKCESCAAQTTLDPNVTSSSCPFCGTNIVASARAGGAIKPKSLLPFKVTRQQARGSFRDWLRSRWFAPGKLKRYAESADRLNGVYVPYWTYDCGATSDYTGQRGEDYWDTEHYTTTENGRTVSKTRRVRKTRWYSVSGRVWNTFDDVLVLASRSLPKKYADRLDPWDLKELVSYSDEYMSGFRAERYQIGLKEGFSLAQDIMDGPIRSSVRSDIGGDHQRIHSLNTTYQDISFKHVLLPIWISAYRYREKVYRFLVNARTGEVQGERPWSVWKIVLTVLAVLAVVGGAAALISMS